MVGAGLGVDHLMTLGAFGQWMDETVDIPLVPDDRDRLIDLLLGIEATSDSSVLSDAFWSDLQDAFEVLDGPLFLRSSFSSFKQAGARQFPLNDIAGIWSLLRRRNPRAGKLLDEARRAKRAAALFAIPWRDIAPWTEFRMFVYDKQLIGISQYAHTEVFPEIHADALGIETRLRNFAGEALSHLPLDRVVMDVLLETDPGKRPVTVIELNPFSLSTDPCLFKWNSGGDFDFGFRYRPPDGAGATQENIA